MYKNAKREGNNFLQKYDRSRIFKLHLYASYTIEKFTKKYYISVGNHSKLTEIGKNG